MENVSEKELLLLLRGSSKAGFLAANALSDSINDFNNVSDLFHDLITCLLVDRDWDCRTNSAKALSCICNKFKLELQNLLSFGDSDGELLSLNDIQVENILKYGIELRAGKSNYAADAKNRELLYGKKWIKIQRKELRKRLGIKRQQNIGANDDDPDRPDHMITESDIQINTPSSSSSSSPSPLVTASVSELQSVESWFVRLVRFMVVGLLDVRWETRHGCSVGLAAIINGLYPNTDTDTTATNINTNNNTNTNVLSSFLVQDIVCSGLSVLMLDYFIDFGSLVSVCPVKESMAQLLANVSRYCNQTNINTIHRKGLTIASHTNHWMVQHGGLVLLKYFWPVHPTHVSQNAIMMECVTLVETALKQSFDDIISSAASLTKSICLVLKFNLNNSSNVNDGSAVEICRRLLMALQDTIFYVNNISESPVVLSKAIASCCTVLQQESTTMITSDTSFSRTMLSALCAGATVTSMLLRKMPIVSILTRRACLIHLEEALHSMNEITILMNNPSLELTTSSSSSSDTLKVGWVLFCSLIHALGIRRSLDLETKLDISSMTASTQEKGRQKHCQVHLADHTHWNGLSVVGCANPRDMLDQTLCVSVAKNGGRLVAGLILLHISCDTNTNSYRNASSTFDDNFDLHAVPKLLMHILEWMCMDESAVDVEDEMIEDLFDRDEILIGKVTKTATTTTNSTATVNNNGNNSDNEGKNKKGRKRKRKSETITSASASSSSSNGDANISANVNVSVKGMKQLNSLCYWLVRRALRMAQEQRGDALASRFPLVPIKDLWLWDLFPLEGKLGISQLFSSTILTLREQQKQLTSSTDFDDGLKSDLFHQVGKLSSATLNSVRLMTDPEFMSAQSDEDDADSHGMDDSNDGGLRRSKRERKPARRPQLPEGADIEALPVPTGDPILNFQVVVVVDEDVTEKKPGDGESDDDDDDEEIYLNENAAAAINKEEVDAVFQGSEFHMMKPCALHIFRLEGLFLMASYFNNAVGDSIDCGWELSSSLISEIERLCITERRKEACSTFITDAHLNVIQYSHAHFLASCLSNSKRAAALLHVIKEHMKVYTNLVLGNVGSRALVLGMLSGSSFSFSCGNGQQHQALASALLNCFGCNLAASEAAHVAVTELNREEGVGLAAWGSVLEEACRCMIAAWQRERPCHFHKETQVALSLVEALSITLRESSSLQILKYLRVTWLPEILVKACVYSLPGDSNINNNQCEQVQNTVVVGLSGMKNSNTNMSQSNSIITVILLEILVILRAHMETCQVEAMQIAAAKFLAKLVAGLTETQIIAVARVTDTRESASKSSSIVTNLGDQIHSCFALLLEMALMRMADSLPQVRQCCSQVLSTLVQIAPLARDAWMRQGVSFVVESEMSQNNTSSDNKDSVKVNVNSQVALLTDFIFARSEPPSLLESKPDSPDGQLLAALRQSSPTVFGDQTSDTSSDSKGLRPYQWAGATWLVHLCRCGMAGILADEMGLGKTLQALVALAILRLEKGSKTQPSLVVCPAAVVLHWEREISRFFGTQLLQGKSRDAFTFDNSCKPKRLINVTGKDVIIMSYTHLINNRDWVIAQQWETVILDEAHLVRNPKTVASRSVLALKCRNRIALSGTPIQNQVDELWSLMHFLIPDFLGSWDSFQQEYARPIKAAYKERGHIGVFSAADWETRVTTQGEASSNMDASSSPSGNVTDKVGAAIEITAAGMEKLRALHKQILPFILRRTKEVVARDLPTKTVIDVYCPLSEQQKEMYRIFQKRTAISDEELERRLVMIRLGEASSATSGLLIHPLKALNYLKLVAVHPAMAVASTHDAYRQRLLQNTNTSGKLIELMRLLLSAGIVSRAESVDADTLVEEVPLTSRELHDRRRERSGRYDVSSTDEEEDDNNDQDDDEDVREKEPADDDINGTVAVDEDDTHLDVDIATTLQAIDGAQGFDCLDEDEDETTGSLMTNVLAPITTRAVTTTEPLLEKGEDESSSSLTGVDVDNQDDNNSNTNTNVITATISTSNKCLIFAHHRSTLDIVEECVLRRHFPSVSYSRLDGSMPPMERARVAERFQSQSQTQSTCSSVDNGPRILLLTARACGLGLNLTAANTVIFLEHDWNPFVDLQAMDRAHRIGQSKPVHVYRLIADGTIEARVMAKQNVKRNVVAEVINEQNMGAAVDITAPKLGGAIWESIQGREQQISSSNGGSGDGSGAVDEEELDSYDIDNFLRSIGVS